MPQAERIPPHFEEAERCVLGSILIDKEVYFKVSEFLTAEDFYLKQNQEIFNAMTDLYKADQPIDVVTVCDCLQRRKSLEACGGRSYVATLSNEVPTTANAVPYAKIVSEKAALRKLINAAGDIVENCFSEQMESAQVLDRAESSIYEIAKNKQTKDYYKVQDVLQMNLEEIKTAEKNGGIMPGLSTGFADLDRMTTGLQNSDLIIVAARPSMGKTAFALNIAQHAALKEGKRVALFSAEMNETSIGYRLLSMDARVSTGEMRSGRLSAEDWESINDSIERQAKAQLLIDATPNISVMEIRNKCRRMNNEGRLDLVVIDYLQILESNTKSENRVQEVSNMTKSLKQLARELNCPMVVLSQLSRGSVQRDGDKRPQLSDLRDSGSIEQDADVVMFLHRNDYFKSKEAAPDNLCDIIIAKQRQGETGTVTLSWLPKYTKFTNLLKENIAIPPQYENIPQPEDFEMYEEQEIQF